MSNKLVQKVYFTAKSDRVRPKQHANQQTTQRTEYHTASLPEDMPEFVTQISLDETLFLLVSQARGTVHVYRNYLEAPTNDYYSSHVLQLDAERQLRFTGDGKKWMPYGGVNPYPGKRKRRQSERSLTTHLGDFLLRDHSEHNAMIAIEESVDKRVEASFKEYLNKTCSFGETEYANR